MRKSQREGKERGRERKRERRRTRRRKDAFREFADKLAASAASPVYVKLQAVIEAAASTASPGRLR